MKVYRKQRVIEALDKQGARLKAVVECAAMHHGLGKIFQLAGRSSNLVCVCRDSDGAPSQIFRALFLQEVIRHSILAPSLVVSHSHSDDDIDRTIEAIDGAPGVYRLALVNGPATYLTGRSIQPVCRPARVTRGTPTGFSFEVYRL